MYAWLRACVRACARAFVHMCMCICTRTTVRIELFGLCLRMRCMRARLSHPTAQVFALCAQITSRCTASASKPNK